MSVEILSLNGFGIIMRLSGNEKHKSKEDRGF